MTTENEWVQLPGDGPKTWPKMLPKGTVARPTPPLTKVAFEASGDVELKHGNYVGHWQCGEQRFYSLGTLIEVQLPAGYRFEGSEVVPMAPEFMCQRCGAKTVCGTRTLTEQWCETCDLGDTPEHLKPLLRAARERVAGTVISIETEEQAALWAPRDASCSLCGYQVFLDFGAQLFSFGTRVQDIGMHARSALQERIAEGRCYPTADARRIGEREFGMVFDGGTIVLNDVTLLPDGSIVIATSDHLQAGGSTRPTCVACSQPMEPRHDGDPTCSPECHQAHLATQRESEAERKYEASDEVYKSRREFGKDGEPLETRIAAVQGLGPLLVDTVLPRSDSRAWPVLNPAAQPGMVRRRPKPKQEAPSAWPEGAGDDYEL